MTGRCASAGTTYPELAEEGENSSQWLPRRTRGRPCCWCSAAPSPSRGAGSPRNAEIVLIPEARLDQSRHAGCGLNPPWAVAVDFGDVGSTASRAMGAARSSFSEAGDGGRSPAAHDPARRLSRPACPFLAPRPCPTAGVALLPAPALVRTAGKESPTPRVGRCCQPDLRMPGEPETIGRIRHVPPRHDARRGARRPPPLVSGRSAAETHPRHRGRRNRSAGLPTAHAG